MCRQSIIFKRGDGHHSSWIVLHHQVKQAPGGTTSSLGCLLGQNLWGSDSDGRSNISLVLFRERRFWHVRFRGRVKNRHNSAPRWSELAPEERRRKQWPIVFQSDTLNNTKNTLSTRDPEQR